MTQGRRFCDPTVATCSPVVSQTKSRNKEIDAPTSFNPYEPRPRRRTNVDRYEPNKETSAAGQSSPRTKRYQKRMTMMKRNSSRVDKKFHAKNVKSGRLTLTSNANLGIFKKGKTSEPINCPNSSYLNFSETKFLSKEAQCPAIPEERPQRSHGSNKSPRASSSEYLDTFLEQELFQSLGSCQQLSVPYEEYVPLVSNVKILSVDELKELYNKRKTIESKQKSDAVWDNATRSSVYDETNTLSPTCEPVVSTHTPTTDKEMLLDFLLDTAQDFDEDVAVELLAELVDPAEASSENGKPQSADLHAGSVEGPRNRAEKISCLSPCINIAHNPAPNSHKTLANLGMIQKQHDNDPPFDAPDTWHHRDMAREIFAGDYYADISSCLDVHRLRQMATPFHTTNQPSMLASVRPARGHATAEPRRFWRCNKLY